MYRRLYQVMKKRIVAIGGGVIGQATAPELIKSGYGVHLLERSRHPVMAASWVTAVGHVCRQRHTIAGNEMDGKADSPLNMRL